MAEKVQFPTNVIQTVALAYPEGREIESQFDPSGKQIMFTTVDGRRMFLSLPVAAKVHSLGLQDQEPFEIGKVEVSHGKRKSIEWQVKRVYPKAEASSSPASASAPAAQQGAAQPQHTSSINPGDGTLAVPVASGAANRPPQPPPPPPPYTSVPSNDPDAYGHQNGTGRSYPVSAVQAAVARLFAESKVLVDGYAQVLDYASKTYGNALRPEDIRSLVLSAYIQAGKGSR